MFANPFSRVFSFLNCGVDTKLKSQSQMANREDYHQPTLECVFCSESRRTIKTNSFFYNNQILWSLW